MILITTCYEHIAVFYGDEIIQYITQIFNNVG